MTATPPLNFPEASIEEACARREPELVALTEAELTVINISVPEAITTALGVIPKLKAIRPTLVKALREFDFPLFDGLEDYTLVLHDAHGEYLARSEQPSVPAELIRETLDFRKQLRLEAEVLVQRGLIDARKLARLSKTRSHAAIATDLGILGRVLKSHWAELRNKTAISKQDVERALRLQARLLRAAGRRDKVSDAVAAAADRRLRAFTLFTRAYAEARAGVMFVRRHTGDGDEIIPSLFAGRKNGRKGVTRAASAEAQSAVAAKKDSTASFSEQPMD